MTDTPLTPAGWTPDQPLRADATDEQIDLRAGWLMGYVLGSNGGYNLDSTPFRKAHGKPVSEGPSAAITVAREFAAACVSAMAEDQPAKLDQRHNGCYAACLAGLTGIPLDELHQEIPDSVTEPESSEPTDAINNEMTRRLRERGWRVENIYKDTPEGFAIASGISARNVNHAVIVKDGKLWHDPHPSRVGLETLHGYEVLIPIIASGYELNLRVVRRAAARTGGSDAE